ncbi:MAG: NHLP family bacteriocin export ABC transporter peptidase/permease/ATPase subunit [Candidatus Wallbacteria bacterium GWC2_49_35]|uniref:NHLP family bacteriocin export ABC transporter peptidase/permease/ATPase subunit n=1 Tax=Candidatus Wallbacteria bacterium GWC2_49_35 TaxID=1817813 RepID=A0A1F7WLH0_9BACT|nr:MAG: NHLP family bacteriocin export ABC transporter peptidase/permease/ATPase subunit [Candidatus Wallbacteria bacterium GWC2_49_35]
MKQQPKKAYKRVKTPTLIQMEAVECGAACLGIVLGYYRKYVPLEELRVECGVSRDGSKASNIVKAARNYGLAAKGYKKEPADLRFFKFPVIIHWNFNHFVVLEGFGNKKVFLNDPAAGPREVSEEELDQSYTGIVMSFEPSEDFVISPGRPGFLSLLASRLTSCRAGLAYVFLIGLFMVVPGLLIPVFSKVFVDDILVGKTTDWLMPLLFGMALTAFLRALLSWIQQNYLLKIELQISLVNSGKFFWHVLRLPIEFFNQRFAGEILNRVQINDTVATLLSRRLTGAGIDMLTLIFYAIIMFQYDVVLTLLCFAVSIVNLLFLRFTSKKRVDQNMKLLQDRGKLSGASMAGLQIIETLKAGGSESDFFMKWAGYHSKLMNSEQRLGEMNQVLSLIPGFLTSAASTMVLAVGGYRVMTGHLSMGMLVAFQSLMASFMQPVNNMVELGSTMLEVEGDINRLNDVLNYKTDQPAEEEKEKEDKENGRPAEPKLKGFLELRNVTFGYSKLSDPLIEDFSLSLKPGSRVALVGGSGSGKSTVAKIIAGLYEPWSGEVLFDGVERAGISRKIICNSVSHVDQDIFLFEGTVKENISLWDRTVSAEDVVTAAKDALIHDDITQRPGGYDLDIEEDGRNFSGGQRQRIEIARALAQNPSIIILDEATSALDPATEKLIDSSIRRRGCTCVIVAHRLSTIRDCDEIIVLDSGMVVQRGTHEELKDAYGAYADLIKLS